VFMEKPPHVIPVKASSPFRRRSLPVPAPLEDPHHSRQSLGAQD
jgi:hypothetical protein